MPTDRPVSRRAFLAAAAALSAASRAWPADAAAADAPLIEKRVEKLYKVAGCTQPNDLQFVADGLWVLDQVDPNKAFKVRPEDGSVLQALQTESIHGSGITSGNGALWISSTKMSDPSAAPRTLKVDPKTGKTLKSWVTPGSGLYGTVTTPSGAHGLKWVDGKYWMAVPASGKLFLMEPETGAIVRSIPAPGVRTHGLAWDDGFLSCVESDGRVLYKLDPKDGKAVARIQLAKTDPVPHGLDIDKGVLWYCDAGSGWICRLGVKTPS
jgi:outer membrane protein assembly factor BamB